MHSQQNSISTLILLTGLQLTPHFSPSVFVSVKAHFVVSEQWSIPVSNDFLQEVTAISTPEHWAACGLSVCRSGCLPSSFPLAHIEEEDISAETEEWQPLLPNPKLPTSSLNSTGCANREHSGLFDSKGQRALYGSTDFDCGLSEGFLHS